ncbi:MAG: carboxypeptidase regulatory-like domain-containing protein [Chloroflexi bacterium]|nr:carboxypeptidase regulatory-like domain-containing protein [Chloroflexota bacterium]
MADSTPPSAIGHLSAAIQMRARLTLLGLSLAALTLGLFGLTTVWPVAARTSFSSSAENLSGLNGSTPFDKLKVQGSPCCTLSLSKGALQSTGQITGVVTAGDTSQPLSNVTVSIYQLNNALLTSTLTDATGQYVVGGLATASYKVLFLPATTYYKPEWYDNQIDVDLATLVAVTDGATTANINAALDHGGQIKGTVTASDVLTPVQNVNVSIYDVNSRIVATATTDISGVYTTTPGLYNGTYWAQFKVNGSTRYVPQFYNNQSSLSTANPINVVAPTIVLGVNVVLAPGAQVTGRVIADFGPSLADVSVTVYDLNGNVLATDVTNPIGVYTTTPGIPSGAYRLQFTPSGNNFIPQYYNNRPNFTLADTVIVTAPNVLSTINASLSVGSQVIGRLTASDSGLPLPQSVVTVYDCNGNVAAGAAADISGFYTTTPGLASGSYRLQFAPFSIDPHLPAYYNNQPTLATADVLTVTAPYSRTGINAALDVGSQIAGKASAALTGALLPNVQVTVYDSNGQIVASALTDQAGIYTTTPPLRGGYYRVGFKAPLQPSPFGAEYYNNKADLASADVITLTPPSTAAGIDVVLSRTARVSGTVLASDNDEPIYGVTISIYDASGLVVATGATDLLGVYTTTPGLQLGSYRLRFDTFAPGLSNPHIIQYYNNKTSYQTADPVIIISSTTAITNLSTLLSPGGQITGTVTAADGGPLAGVNVTVFDSSGAMAALAVTNQAGVYATTGLASGAYRLQYTYGGTTCAFGPWAAQFYQNKPDMASALTVTVTAPKTTGGINVVLTGGSSVTGRVTVSGNGLAGVTLVNNAGVAAVTDATGAYTFTALITGTYTITPTLKGYAFTPPVRVISVPQNAINQDFSALALLYLLIIAR